MYQAARRCRSRRRAVSPVVATVTIIAVTLVASVAMGGSVFGSVSSSASTARVQASMAAIPTLIGNFGPVVLCSGNSGNGFAGYVQLYNSGTAVTSASAFVITYAGQTVNVVLTGSCSIPPQSSLFLLVVSLPLTPISGEAYSGHVTTANGAEVLFMGSFS